MDQNQEPLSLQECAESLLRAFNALGELEIKGKHAETVSTIKQIIAGVNNSIVAHKQKQDEADKKLDKKSKKDEG